MPPLGPLDRAIALHSTPFRGDGFHPGAKEPYLRWDPSLRLPDPSPAGLPAPAYREASTPPVKRPPPRRRPPPPPPRAPRQGVARRRLLPAGRVLRAAACRPTRA